jgi:hypothetical protein
MNSLPKNFITKSTGVPQSWTPVHIVRRLRRPKETAMSIISTRTLTFALAAAVIGVTSFASFEASAWPLKPGISPMPGKIGQPSGGCPGGLVGCTPNTYTPGNNGGGNWHGGHWGYGGGFGLSVNVAQPVSDGDCYYVRRRIMTDMGVVMKRQLVCE